jgi:outer membrane protein assembly factor BamB
VVCTGGHFRRTQSLAALSFFGNRILGYNEDRKRRRTELKRDVSCAGWILLALAGIVGRAEGQIFPDPAPPVLQTVATMPAPEPRSHPGLKFHAPPKPLAAGAVTQDWRSFLGPAHNATSTETPLLKRFGKSAPPIVWEVEKGEGYASPAVVGDRVLLFHRLEENEVIECLQAETGKRFWKFAYPTAYRDRYGFSEGPRCQPISDGERVYTYGAEGKLHCLNLTTGQVLWKRDILKEFKLKQNFFGVGATPLLEGDLLILNIGEEGGPCVAGLDKRTGKMVWGAGNEWTSGYASPIPATISGKRRVFVFTGGESWPPTGGLLCIEPIRGEVISRLPWRAKRNESVNASSPLVLGSQIYISECYGPGGTLLEMLPDGALRTVWSSHALNTHFMTAIHKNGYLYGLDGHGPQNAPLVCIDLKTGKEMWRNEPEWEETLKSNGEVRKYRLSTGLASLILVDGQCLMLTEYGRLVWLDLNPTAYRELDQVSLFLARETWSMPALSRGLLYVCQNSRGEDDSHPRLICYDMRDTIHKESTKIRRIDPPEKGFFTKELDYEGIPIKAPEVVADQALFTARDKIAQELKNLPDACYNLKIAGAELHIIGKDQVTSDLPEHRHLKGKPFDGNLTVDQRTRGLGGLLTSCGEENLLQLPGDRYHGRDICIHEFAHNIQDTGLSNDVRQKIREQYKRSLEKGLWKGSYAATNEHEYFAELSMWYFGTHGDMNMTGTKPAKGPEGLKAYDPEAFTLLDDLYSGRIPVKRNLK